MLNAYFMRNIIVMQGMSQIQLSPDPTIQGVHIAQLDGALDQRGDSIVAEATSVVACMVKELLCLGPKLYGVLVE